MAKDEMWFLRVCHQVPHELYKLGPASRVKVPLVTSVQPLTDLLPKYTAVNAAMFVPILSVLSPKRKSFTDALHYTFSKINS